ncbi:hypothetical protein SAMN05661012_01304 [Chitinophaga sancti]|uniref:Uncharacterized protein n=1 Tax=Chitinophaga sancti TaxID=1004 RepID=A0A1K1NHB4_9BACT|nr:hypothetical protein SAMN05661012_01304 [Chitinophaga sancti]
MENWNQGIGNSVTDLIAIVAHGPKLIVRSKKTLAAHVYKIA